MKESDKAAAEIDLLGCDLPEISRRTVPDHIVLEIHESTVIARQSFCLDWNIVCISSDGFSEFSLETESINPREFVLDHGRILLIPRKFPISHLSIRTRGKLVVIGFSHAYLSEIAAAQEFFDFDSIDHEFREDHLGFRLGESLSGIDSLTSIAYIEALARSLASHIIARQKTNHLFNHKKEVQRSSGSRVSISKVINYIHDNLHLPLKVSEISKDLGYKRSSLDMKFKKEMGVSIHDYILNCRMNRARLLLTDDSLTISSIAAKTGFFDHSHFTAAFRETFGITPSAFRVSFASRLYPEEIPILNKSAPPSGRTFKGR